MGTMTKLTRKNLTNSCMRRRKFPVSRLIGVEGTIVGVPHYSVIEGREPMNWANNWSRRIQAQHMGAISPLTLLPRPNRPECGTRCDTSRKKRVR